MKLRNVSIMYWIVSIIPKKVVYFCYMHVLAYATTRDYGNTNPHEVNPMEVIDRYVKGNKINL
jgi:hypothetical protein